MKPVFGIDLTTNKKNDCISGEEFLSVKTSPALTQSYTSATQKTSDTIQQTKLPLALRIVYYICGFWTIATFAGLVRSLAGSAISIPQAYQNAPWIFWSCGICAVIWLGLMLAQFLKKRSVLNAEDNTRILSNLDSICNSIYTELGVPAYARDVDVLSFFYKVKNGTVKPCDRGVQFATYSNCTFKMFTDGELFYLANMDGKYAFSLSEIKALHLVKKAIMAHPWTKDISMFEEPYKQYKLTTNNFGSVRNRYYYILELERNGQAWGLYFPSYELPALQAMTGKAVKEK